MKAKILVILGGSSVLAADLSLPPEYLNYMSKNNKSYSTANELKQRVSIWSETDNYIKNYKVKGMVLKHNKFSDMSKEERKEYLGKKQIISKLPFDTTPKLKQTDNSIVQRQLAATTCSAGFYSNNNKCVTCPLGCKTCTSASSCQSCNSANFTYSNGKCSCSSGVINPDGKDCSKCQIQNYYDNTLKKCTGCGTNCDSCISATQCTNCSNVYTNKAGKCSCEFPFEFRNNQCQCPDGKVQSGMFCLTPETMKKCENGYYNPGDDNCAKCGIDCIQCKDLTGECIQCMAGKFAFDNIECFVCPWPIGQFNKSPSKCVKQKAGPNRVIPAFSATETSVDWRSWNVVQPIQNQYSCGCCYTFSTAAAAESAYAIKTGILYKLSEQHIIDCDTYSNGCNGGMQKSAQYLLHLSGTVLQDDYPYTNMQGQCRDFQMKKVFQLNYPGFQTVDSNKQAFKAGLREQVLNISFGVGDDFWNYSTGIYTGQQCAPVVNHAMNAVGYGIENGVEYAIIRNQWGVDWGEKGYMKVLLVDDNYGTCGLYSDNTFTTVGYD